MSEPEKTNGVQSSRKVKQTVLAQVLVFVLACIIVYLFYDTSLTMAKAGVGADTVAVILADFKMMALICFGAVGGQLAVFTAGNVMVHREKTKVALASPAPASNSQDSPQNP